MAGRPALPEPAVDQILQHRANRVPSHLAEQVRIELEVRGPSVSIFECRPPLRPGAHEWSRIPNARLRYAEATGDWRLYRANRSGRRRDHTTSATRDVVELLDALGAYPTGVFCD